MKSLRSDHENAIETAKQIIDQEYAKIAIIKFREILSQYNLKTHTITTWGGMGGGGLVITKGSTSTYWYRVTDKHRFNFPIFLAFTEIDSWLSDNWDISSEIPEGTLLS